MFLDAGGRPGPCWRDFQRQEEAKAAAVPADHCVGPDDYEHIGPVSPNGRKPDPEDLVRSPESEPFGAGPAENRELLAEGKVLQGQLPAGTNQRV
jgi:hypothetical protein